MLRLAGRKSEVDVMEKKRDYSLVGESTRIAIETGLASAEWYHTDVPRKAMKELMQRS
ncbi:fatty acid desaturase, partial [Mesorhizobium sp. M7A.F.Ca.CA.002.03.2.1]